EAPMVRRDSCHRRPGAVAVEAALVYPVMLTLLLGLLVGGLGIFRYQEVASLAREAARWTSVRGTKWQQDTGAASPDQNTIRTSVVLPIAIGMDPNKLSVEVHLIDG